MTNLDDLTRHNEDDLVALYVSAAVAFSRLHGGIDYRAANKAFDRLAAVYRELRARGAQKRLRELLDHPDDGVRFAVASHAMEFAPDEGEPILRRMADGSGVRALSAGETLKAWKAGTLRFP